MASEVDEDDDDVTSKYRIIETSTCLSREIEKDTVHVITSNQSPRVAVTLVVP